MDQDDTEPEMTPEQAAEALLRLYADPNFRRASTEELAEQVGIDAQQVSAARKWLREHGHHVPRAPSAQRQRAGEALADEIEARFPGQTLSGTGDQLARLVGASPGTVKAAMARMRERGTLSEENVVLTPNVDFERRDTLKAYKAAEDIAELYEDAPTGTKLADAEVLVGQVGAPEDVIRRAERILVAHGRIRLSRNGRPTVWNTFGPQPEPETETERTARRLGWEFSHLPKGRLIPSIRELRRRGAGSPRVIQSALSLLHEEGVIKLRGPGRPAVIPGGTVTPRGPARQIADQMEADFESDPTRWTPGTMIGTPSRLARTYGVSQRTIYTVYRILEDDGWIDRAGYPYEPVIAERPSEPDGPGDGPKGPGEPPPGDDEGPGGPPAGPAPRSGPTSPESGAAAAATRPEAETVSPHR